MILLFFKMATEKCLYQSLIQLTGKSHGLGDLIRGMLVCSKICDNYGMKHIVLTKEHPIGEHLEYTYDESSIPKNLILNDNPVPSGLTTFTEGSTQIYKIASAGTHKIYTNFDYKLAFLKNVDHLLPPAQRTKIRNILTPNANSLVKLNEIRSKLPEKYEILHFRFGDSTHGQVPKHKIELCKQFILRKYSIHKYELPLIVCCDSPLIKRSLPEEILVIPIEPVHVGNTTDKSKVLDTLIEYWIIANSERIISYTNYNWVSGFVRWVSWLNDIPLDGYVKFEYDKLNSGIKVTA